MKKILIILLILMINVLGVYDKVSTDIGITSQRYYPSIDNRPKVQVVQKQEENSI